MCLGLLGIGGWMLLEKERERLRAVLQSRTASHAERKQAREMLEAELSSSDPDPQREASAPQNRDRPKKSAERR
jgi:hypothetical protein